MSLQLTELNTFLTSNVPSSTALWEKWFTPPLFWQPHRLSGLVPMLIFLTWSRTASQRDPLQFWSPLLVLPWWAFPVTSQPCPIYKVLVPFAATKWRMETTFSVVTTFFTQMIHKAPNFWVCKLVPMRPCWHIHTNLPITLLPAVDHSLKFFSLSLLFS